MLICLALLSEYLLKTILLWLNNNVFENLFGLSFREGKKSLLNLNLFIKGKNEHKEVQLLRLMMNAIFLNSIN